MPDMKVFSVEPVNGAAATTVPQDFGVEILFVDSEDQSIVLADFTGAHAVKASQLIPLIPIEDFQSLVRERAPGLLWRMAQEAEPNG